MQTEEFREWLKEQGYQPNVANTRVGNCLTVCNYEDDLDSLYANDKCQDLMNRLCYSTQYERNNAPVRYRIPINGNTPVRGAGILNSNLRYLPLIGLRNLCSKVCFSY